MYETIKSKWNSGWGMKFLNGGRGIWTWQEDRKGLIKAFCLLYIDVPSRALNNNMVTFSACQVGWFCTYLGNYVIVFLFKKPTWHFLPHYEHFSVIWKKSTWATVPHLKNEAMELNRLLMIFIFIFIYLSLSKHTP